MRDLPQRKIQRTPGRDTTEYRTASAKEAEEGGGVVV